MPIHPPGIRSKHGRGKKGRNIVAMLSLTAMVDMFTVLAVFLLQNYQTTGEAIELSDKVELPKASSVKELQPAHVIVVSKQHVMIDEQIVLSYDEVKAANDWKLEKLLTRLQEEFKKADEKTKAPLQALRDGNPEEEKRRQDAARRITVQADRSVDFLTVKKVMYTVTEAGGVEVNFAVIKDDKAVR